MFQAVVGMTGGVMLVAAAGRALYVMAREEYKDLQSDYETGYQKRRAEDGSEDIDPELGLNENEIHENENEDEDERLQSSSSSYVEYSTTDQTVRPQSPFPSVPSLIRVPAPGSTFPPPPPRSPRTSDAAIVVAQPALSESEGEDEEEKGENMCRVHPTDSYVDYAPAPEVADYSHTTVTTQSDFSRFAVIHPPSPAPPHVSA
jgi:hypothetical protein